MRSAKRPSRIISASSLATFSLVLSLSFSSRIISRLTAFSRCRKMSSSLSRLSCLSSFLWRMEAQCWRKRASASALLILYPSFSISFTFRITFFSHSSHLACPSTPDSVRSETTPCSTLAFPSLLLFLIGSAALLKATSKLGVSKAFVAGRYRIRVPLSSLIKRKSFKFVPSSIRCAWLSTTSLNAPIFVFSSSFFSTRSVSTSFFMYTSYIRRRSPIGSAVNRLS
mmetsp:Transcript_13388/g.35139  ORF Transcript_13388/g.35139 Transcript_13388/m.35139 type:complete len:226 (-) Transcript_13388:952-1629(-)